jgi:hypothetical protein
MNNFLSKAYFFVKYFIPVFMVVGIIFYLSAQPNLGSWMVNPLENILRKGAHFTEYGFLTFFIWRLFYNGWKFFTKSAFWFSLIMVTLYAGSDEFHQSFVEGRNGSIMDVVIDFLSIFIILQIILFCIKRKINNLVLSIVGIICLIIVVGIMIQQMYRGNESMDRHIINDESVVDIENRESVIIKNVKNNQEDQNTKNLQSVEDSNIDEKTKAVIILPTKINQKVSFTTQSPFAKWDELHEESCEEASLIMLKYYNDKLKGKRPGLLPGVNLSKEVAEDEIQKLVKYQIKKYGDFYDTNIKINKEIGEEYFGMTSLKILEDFTIEDLKGELAQGGIILIPTAGRELHNPNFKAPGPLYHNLVIVGYDDEAVVDSAGRSVKGIFITNDPGTRMGENYKYDQQVLYNAIHDFPGDVNKITEGKKRALVLRGLKVK